jgi:hypothetical protein
MRRLATLRNPGDTIGICFTVKGDFVGEFGCHVGCEVELPPARDAQIAHSMEVIFAGILNRSWLFKKPRDVHCIWPA